MDVDTRLVPDGSQSRTEMERLQRDIADEALFDDALPDEIPMNEGRLVAGVDQAFDDDVAVSAVVVVSGGSVVERVLARQPAEIPYVPGLLSFREGGAVLDACSKLEHEPDLLLVDGSGRIHFREAGLATHVGVALDVPAVGVAKGLLCGQPRRSTEGLATGERVAIEADEDVTAPDGTVIGHALQTRQYEQSSRHINPVYVSPGHRVSAGTAVDLVERHLGKYKLPEPIRRADSYAGECS